MIGRTLNHFKLEETLGQGGMGVVYRALDTRLERRVAIKVLKPEVMQDPERQQRFQQEARTASAVNHPSVAQIFDVDTSDDVTFIVMELVEGRTVRELLASGELDLLSSLEIAVQVAEGLGKAHDSGVVHRDIKSDNVKVTADGHAKILDFGLAKLDPLRASTTATNASQLETLAKTQAGMIMGTLSYMSPEQARGRPVDHRSDIFSLGVMVYEMAAGTLPFDRESAIDTLHAIAFEETRPVDEVRAGLPAGLKRIVARCLQKRPEDRYQSAAKLGADLRALSRDIESGVSRPVPIWERLGDGVSALKRVSLPTTGFVVAGIALVAVLLLYREGLFGTVATIGLIGFIAYRRLRGRRQRLVRKITSKLKKSPEIELVTFNGREIIVVARAAKAKLYLRVNRLVERANKRIFLGDPLVVSVRLDVPSEELRTLLRNPGVVYVRDDVVAGA